MNAVLRNLCCVCDKKARLLFALDLFHWMLKKEYASFEVVYLPIICCYCDRRVPLTPTLITQMIYFKIKQKLWTFAPIIEAQSNAEEPETLALFLGIQSQNILPHSELLITLRASSQKHNSIVDLLYQVRLYRSIIGLYHRTYRVFLPESNEKFIFLTH